MALLFTFITGVFFIFGYIINLFIKNKQKVSLISISMAFVVMFNLIFFDILPEVFESKSILVFIFVLLGIFMLKIMDLFVPHHHHDHKEIGDNEHEHDHHLEHIGIITILALSLHNVVESMALYNVAINDLYSGGLMCLAIGLHNMPLGFQICNNLQKKKILYLCILVLSGFLGGIISVAIGETPEIYTIYILGFTLGMLLYLTFGELFKELISGLKNKYSIYGIIIGIVFIIITNLI